MKLTIGSRGSRLALIQAHAVKDAIQAHYSDWDIAVRTMVTTGDRNRSQAISQIGGKEIFVKEIEQALLDGAIDLAVHSMKDMPAVLPEGLRFAFVPKRADARDLLILREVDRLEDLPEKPVIGTGSKRRGHQLLAFLPGARLRPIRGNIETRLKKMESEPLDGVVLAAAAIDRLGLNPPHRVLLSTDQMVPSPGQGILGVEMRTGDDALYRALRPLNDPVSEEQGRLERQFLRAVGGSCALPVGAYAEIRGDGARLTALLGRPDAVRTEKVTLTGARGEDLGLEAARRLLDGADSGR